MLTVGHSGKLYAYISIFNKFTGGLSHFSYQNIQLLLNKLLISHLSLIFCKHYSTETFLFGNTTMASASLKKILVHVKNSNQEIIQANFNSCIFDQLGVFDKEVVNCKVKCSLRQNKLILQNCGSEENSEDCVTIVHPSFCPLLIISEEERSSLTEETLGRGINVGVAIILETADEKILLTRRARHMRTFPGVWVPPGGHVELNETLEEAGLRELGEETGLSIPPSDKKSSSILTLWESVFPPILSFGTPSRHHVVVYWHILTDKSSSDLESEIKLHPDEVDACLWLPFDLTKGIEEGMPFVLENMKNLQYISLNEKGEQVRRNLDPDVLVKKLPPRGTDTERITTGTQYAIEMWVEKKKSSKKNVFQHAKSNL